MIKESKEIFTRSKPTELSVGLFDRIIAAIKREQEFQHTKRLLFGFLFLLVISVAAAPFSWTILAKQVESSGILYFISMATNDLQTFFVFWQDFSLAILESLPILGIIVFAINIALMLFTLRLFLHKKQFLFRYLMHNFYKLS